MKCKSFKVEYIPSEAQGITGVKKKNLKELSNVVAGGEGTFIESTPSELILTVINEGNEWIEFDVKEQVLKAFNRKNMSDEFEFDLMLSLPQYMELEESGSSFKISKTTINEWKVKYKMNK